MDTDKKRIYGLALAAGMLITGTCNTIFSKYQNMQLFQCSDPTNFYDCKLLCPGAFTYPCLQTSATIDGTYNVTFAESGELFSSCTVTEGAEDSCTAEAIPFEQPVFQTFVMFVGEFVCLLAFYVFLLVEKYKAAKNPNTKEPSMDTTSLNGLKKFLMALPTLCDLTATTLMNIGLIYCSASVYQMLRGMVVVFTGTFSVIFLRRKLWAYNWVAMFFVVAGVSIVGLVSLLGDSSADNDVVGVLLVILAQVFTATQFVVEEKFLGGYNLPPMQAVGLEGIFGVGILAIAMPIMYFGGGKPEDVSAVGNFFDIRFAFDMFLKYPEIAVSSIGCVISISLFNFFGLTITKVMSATSRSTIDAMRTLLVWICSLSFGWEIFVGEQIIGFVVLVFGTFMYNKVFTLPYIVGKYLYPSPEELAIEEEKQHQYEKENATESQGLLDHQEHRSGGSVQVHPDDIYYKQDDRHGDL